MKAPRLDLSLTILSLPQKVSWAVALIIWFALQPLLGAQVIWSGADVISNLNTNWSDATNWTGGTPGPSASVVFFDQGSNGIQGVVNNIVNSNTAISTLQYGNTNGFHATQINAGVTLAVTNKAVGALVFAGTGTDNGVNQALYATVTGAGSLAVANTNSGSAFVVQQGSSNSGSHVATLDLSGLASFSLTAGQLLVAGYDLSSSGASNYLSGTLYLARTNRIRLNGAAPAIDVGDASSNPGNTSYLYLGQTNAIFADSITIGHSKSTATLAFNPALVGGNPLLYLTGNTNARVTLLTVGDDSAQATSGISLTGTMNLSGGTVNTLVDTCYVAESQTSSGSGTATGILDLGAGVFNVNTLYAGYLSTTASSANVYGTVNLTNGTLVVNGSLFLGYDPGAPGTAYGTLNVTNGTVLANNIVSGGTSKLTMNGGWLAVSNTLCTPSAPLGTLTVSNGATLQFWVANHQTNAATTKLASDNSGAISIGAMPIVLAYPTSYPLIYSPAGGANAVRFALNALPNGYQGYISNNNSSLILLVITNGPAVPKLDVWGGGMNNNWDTNTPNWTNSGAAVAYNENDFVLFNDSANTNQVNLTGSAPHSPYLWTVTNNILNYKFAGTNSVTGAAGLIKAGGAPLTLAESGDTFSGGITVNGGTVVLDGAASAIAGGLTIASSATAQIGNNDANGSLPAGAVTDNGALVFNQTITNLVSTAISGSGSLTQNGSGVLTLIATNGYSGNTVVLRGTLALAGGGSIAASANVVVSNATLDVSGAAGTNILGNLDLTNATLRFGIPTLNVSSLNLGGTSNTIKVAALPPILFYPTNLTLIQTTGRISGYNFVLGSLPAANPAFAGTLVTNVNSVGLALTAGPISSVSATITFAATNAGLLLNPSFPGLSYEKSYLTGSLFTSNDTSLVSMFSQIAPAVLRVGGNSVDMSTCWGGLSNLTAITPAQVDAFAGFVKALPTNWHVIYGINMAVNNPTNCAAEAAYAAKALGSSLLGFEIGNECDLYAGNGLRPSNFTYSQFLAQWRTLAGAITNAVPGWATTNGGNGWTLTGPVSAYNTSVYTVPFAGDEAGVLSLVSQHYYRANGQSPTSTLEYLLQPDTGLPGTVKTIVSAANTAGLPLGFRMAECGSFYNGGAPNVSDAYGTALWSLDFMFTLALNGCQGLNFHGGGSGTGYTPIADNGTKVIQARPEFYGLKMFSLVCQQGSVIPATLTLASNINFTAYGVRRAGGGVSTLLNNKETNDSVQVSVNLGPGVTAAQVIELTAPVLDATNGYTLGGAVINPDGSWGGGVQWVIPATNGQLGLIVPPITAILLNPVVTEGTNLLLASDALNTTSWTGATNWTDGLAPHPGANYFTGTNLLRTPTTGSSVTFIGDSLTLGPEVTGNPSMILKLNSPGGTYLINNCTNAGGVIEAGLANCTNYLSGTNWVAAAPSALGCLNDNTRCIVLTNLTLSGSAALSNGVASSGNGLGTIVYAGNAIHFTGPLVTSSGVNLMAWSQTNLGGNPANFNPAQFVLDNGSFQPLASMALTNANSGVTINPGGGAFTIGSNLVLTIANPIAGTGGLTNQGGGCLVLSGTNPYSGLTAVNAGTLALQGAGSIANSPLIIVAGGAAFDSSGLISVFNLGSNQTLSNSSVKAVISGTNNTGAGTLSLLYDGMNPAFIITNGGLALAASTSFSVNNAGAQLAANSSHKVIARATTGNAGFVAGTAPVSVTVAGNGAAAATTLQITGGELFLNVAPILPATGTNITVSVIGNQLNLSWPANYIGWLLQSNPLSLTSTGSWFSVPGAAGTNRVQISIDPSQTNVFFRMTPP